MKKEKVENETIEEEILKNIKKAINKIGKSFYKIVSANKNERARERVFCYELYKQLGLLDFNHKFDIHAELDKRGFYEIDNTPDFLFHKQGTHENHCVMEVKATLDNCKDIIKDFKTLTSFLNGKGELKPYKLAIFFIFNHLYNELVDCLKEKKTLLKQLEICLKKKEINLNEYSDKIIILCKKDINSEIEESTLKEIIEKI